MHLPIIAVLALAAIAFRAPAQEDIERKLAWVESADPVKMFADSSHVGHTHFLTVCGYSCFEPEMDALEYAHCYAGAATKLTIDPTGDVIQSKRQSQLKGELFQFAKRYNTLVRKELDRTGRRHCPVEERWDGYWLALDSLAKQIPAHPYESFVLATTMELRDRPDFQLHVQDERDLSREIYTRVCALSPRYGIVGRVRFAVTTGNINDHPRRHPEFACVGGNVAQ
jgi:hypothetical protein